MPGLVDGALDRDALARELLDEHGHLRILQVVLFVLDGDQRLRFLGREPAHDHRADEGQRNGAAAIDPDLAPQVVDAEHLHFDEILRTDPIIVRHHLARRGRPYARRTWSNGCWSDVDPGLSGVGHRARGDVCGDRFRCRRRSLGCRARSLPVRMRRQRNACDEPADERQPRPGAAGGKARRPEVRRARTKDVGTVTSHVRSPKNTDKSNGRECKTYHFRGALRKSLPPAATVRRLAAISRAAICRNESARNAARMRGRTVRNTRGMGTLRIVVAPTSAGRSISVPKHPAQAGPTGRDPRATCEPST